MLHCPRCGQANPAQSNFCANCGASLMGSQNPDTTLVIPVITDDVDVEDLTSDDEAAISELRPGSALLVVRRPSLEERFLIDQAATTAGRHPEADIFLDDVTVSRHHAEFLLGDDGGLSVRDLGSLNGTYVNKQLIDKDPVAVRTGDEVQIGKFKMVCFVGGVGAR